MYGGVGDAQQRRALNRGVDVLVACPGRLGDLVRQRALTLDAVEIVVVDEADRMSDMGFLPDVRRLLDLTPATRQTLLFSATLDGAVEVLSRRYQNDPVRHDVVGADTQRDSTACHVFWKVEGPHRTDIATNLVPVGGTDHRLLSHASRRRPSRQATHEQRCTHRCHSRRPLAEPT